MSFSFIKREVDKRKTLGLYRQRQCINSNVGMLMDVQGEHYLNFASNDYLGLSQSDDVLQSYAEGLSLYGASGSASSLVTGYHKEHQKLEETICEFTGKSSALLFSSGYAANQAICNALFQTPLTSVRSRDDLIIADKLMHASFVEAASACKAELKRFKHQDVAHLLSLLKRSSHDNILVATEGVFSMDGDVTNVSDITSVLGQCSGKTMLMLDDAHALGVTGVLGMGSCDEDSIYRDDVHILMATFGKAVGTSGAFIATSSDIAEYLTNFAKHYVYSTAIPPAVARATYTSLKLIRESDVRLRLQENIHLFRQACKEQGIPLSESVTPIQPIHIGSPELVVQCAERLKRLGIWVGCIRTPTVPKNTDRLRITLSALHQKKDILVLVDALALSLSALSIL